MCDSKHTGRQTLIAHVKEHHSNYRCDHCQQQFNKQNLFVQHMKETHNDLPFKCSFCEKKFITRCSCLDHENTHTKKLTCDLCNKQFACKQTLRTHFSWHNGTNKKYVCDKCGHSFNDQTNLNVHIRTVHEKVRPFHCTICQKKFSAKKHLKEHFRTHTGERPYQCDVCLAAFMCSTRLKKHQLTHGNITRRYTCMMCNSRFTERGPYRKHVRSHTGSLPHKCHICSKDFMCKYSYRRHVDQHSGIKAFECSICEMKFTQKNQMHRHMANIHNPNKKIVVKTKCEICKQNVSDIEKHKKSHAVRPFSCHLCNKSYPENNTLTRHIKNIHLEKKSHSCADCGKRYTLKKSLTIHKLKVHGCALKVEGDDSFDAAVTAYAIKNNKI